MEDLIEALQIFAKYMEPTRYPTICVHDKLIICCNRYDLDTVDLERLEELDFIWNNEYWESSRFGSA
jgi:hypothetical protein